MLVEALQDVPAPVSVLGVLGEPEHVEQTLHRLRSQQVVSVSRLEERQTFKNQVVPQKTTLLRQPKTRGT